MTSIQLAPTMMDLTSVLARMDFLVTGKLAKVGKVVSTQILPGFRFFCDTKRTFFIAPCRGIPIPESVKFLLAESRVQVKGSGIPLRIGIQNPDSIDRDWNQVPGIRNPQPGIQNPILSWIPLHGANSSS